MYVKLLCFNVWDVLLWKPTHGHQPRGRPKKTYIDQLMDDTGCRIEIGPIAMEYRETVTSVFPSEGSSWSTQDVRIMDL